MDPSISVKLAWAEACIGWWSEDKMNSFASILFISFVNFFCPVCFIIVSNALQSTSEIDQKERGVDLSNNGMLNRLEGRCRDAKVHQLASKQRPCELLKRSNECCLDLSITIEAVPPRSSLCLVRLTQD